MVEPHEDGRRQRYAHRRDELLAAATEHVLENGLSNLSLRKVATTVGVSHATLVHHFATKEGLVSAIVDRVLTRAYSSPDLRSEEGLSPLQALWVRAVAPAGQRSIRLFLAITGEAMHNNPDLAAAVDRSIRQRNALLEHGLIAAGCPIEQALPLATYLLGTMRGLMVDLLVTGDGQRVDAAFEFLLRGMDDIRARWLQDDQT
nr:TetR family transcriptional regulator [Rhodococcus wratislaviensis]